uniref:Synaptotagmin like 1 n=1 Tax=Capra hircus TaxID=9925 RepID=A0A8C2NMI8_CAPHI
MPQRGHPAPEELWSLPGLLMAREPEPEADGLLDLSFLTEEEQEAIAEVLKRDAHLRQLEEGRISKLRASLADPGQLKILTGDWFQEARSQRHHHAHFGSDLVRASIRRKKGCRGERSSPEEAQAAGKETEEALEPRLSVDEGPQERFSEAEAGEARGCSQDPERIPGGERLCPRLRAVRDQEKPREGRGLRGRPGHLVTYSPPETQAASEMLENGEETPGPDPSFDRMLSSSSSMSSLNSSTLSGSQMSLSGEPEAGAVQVRGSLHFALRYEVKGPLPFTSVPHLPLSSYVKSYLLPDKQSKRKTTVKKRNLNPVFNEILRVPPSPDDLPSRGLLSLSLKYVPAGSEGPGLPPSGELHFWVKEVQDLIPLRSGSPDTFVQCSVLPDDSRASRQRTRVVRRSLNPMFNHTMVYDGFGPADLRQACAELSLWDHGALGSRQLGGTRLSLGTGEQGLSVWPWLWQTLLERPCEWVDGLLPLRTNLAPRT